MNRFTRVVVPCLAFAALVAACDDNDNDTTGINTNNTANVRFINAIPDASGNLALTANGSMVGSSQSLLNSNSTFTCSTVPAGSNSLAFGTANTGGTGIASSLGTMTSLMPAGGNFTLLATGTAANPQLLVIDNRATTTAPAGFANVRFVNATGTPIDFFANSAGSTTLGTPTTSGQAAFSQASSFTQVPITNGAFTFTSAGSTTPLMTSTGSFSSGGNFTVILAPGPNGVGFTSFVLNGNC
jgi:hypothetical protein